jgi:hypothetical protein
MNAPESVDVVLLRAGGCSKSEQSGGVHVDAPESQDVLCLKQGDAGGQSRVEECTWMK